MDEPLRWSVVSELMRRPQPVTLPMVALFSLIPFYLVIGSVVHDWPHHVPEIALDRMMALDPAWSLVYTSLFLAALLPAFVIHDQELLRRTILGFMLMWVAAFACFVAYPTLGPRPARYMGEGFSGWALRMIYSSDHRYNCLPSLHVAQCFFAAFACGVVNRRVGAVACVWALLVGLSTVYTKQHYVLDVVTGMLLAVAAYAIVLRTFRREAIADRERRYAPVLALGAVAIYGLMAAVFGILYAIGVEPAT